MENCKETISEILQRCVDTAIAESHDVTVDSTMTSFALLFLFENVIVVMSLIKTKQKKNCKNTQNLSGFFSNDCERKAFLCEHIQS